jgi:hypothetical protein
MIKCWIVKPKEYDKDDPSAVAMALVILVVQSSQLRMVFW